VRRGEVWWADLPAPVGRRPVLLLSRNEVYDNRLYVTVALLTTRKRELPTEVKVEGLPEASVVNLDNINTIPKSVLRQAITTLSERRMRQVEAAIRFALGMDD
jgi:mRNA interferase MazF